MTLRLLLPMVLTMVVSTAWAQSIADSLFGEIWILKSPFEFPLYEVGDRVFYKADRGELILYLDGYERKNGQTGIVYFYPEVAKDTLTLTLIEAYPLPYQKVPDIKKFHQGMQYVFIKGDINEKDLLIQRGTPIFYPDHSSAIGSSQRSFTSGF